MATNQGTNIDDFVRDMLAEATAKFPDVHFALFAVTPNQGGNHDMSLASNMERDLLKSMVLEYVNDGSPSEIEYDTKRAN